MSPRFATPPTPEREVACCWCGHGFRVSRKAESVVCPGCSRRAVVADVIVRGKLAPGSVATCGRFVVERKSKATPRRVVAGTGVEVFGELDSHVETPGAVIVGPKGVLRGRVRARAIHVEPGADLRDVVIEILTPGGVVSAGASGAAAVVEAKPERARAPVQSTPPEVERVVQTEPVARKTATPRPPVPREPEDEEASGSTRVTPGGTVRLRIG